MSIKPRTFLIILVALIPLMALGRVLQIIDPQKLVADAKLVFVGRVKSVTDSDMKTALSYVPYDGVTFQWQIAKVEVLEAFKGVRKGDIIRVAMLAIDKRSKAQPSYCPPGMLEPYKEDIFLFCLGATAKTNVFAALTAPYDENLSIFPLYRSERNSDWFVDDDMMKKLLCGEGEGRLPSAFEATEKARDKEFALIFSLASPSGEIQSAKVKEFRETFASKINTAPSSDLVYLEWETVTNSYGWQSDIPKGYQPTNVNGK